VTGRMALVLFPLLFFFASIGSVKAGDVSFADQFLGSPLLILVGLIVIVIIAFIYHKIRR
jgi:cadmium resistance protein CadD (predicted permease)